MDDSLGALYEGSKRITVIDVTGYPCQARDILQRASRPGPVTSIR